jgi:hypothetical protein
MKEEKFDCEAFKQEALKKLRNKEAVTSLKSNPMKDRQQRSFSIILVIDLRQSQVSSTDKTNYKLGLKHLKNIFYSNISDF